MSIPIERETRFGAEARLGAALVMNSGIVAFQVAFGLLAGSLGLLADAGHNLADLVALALSWAAARWARRPPTERKTFGYHRSGILAALANSAVLVVLTGVLGVFAVIRLFHPAEVKGSLVVVAAAAGLVLNLLGAALLRPYARHDLNVRSAVMHLLSDAGASLGVLVAGAAIALSGGLFWLDSAVMLLVGGFVVREAVVIARATIDVLLEGVPREVDMARLGARLAAVPGVCQVHDLHVWSLGPGFLALSAHVALAGQPTLAAAQDVGAEAKAVLEAEFGISHATLEFELEECAGGGEPCAPAGTAACDNLVGENLVGEQVVGGGG